MFGCRNLALVFLFNALGSSDLTVTTISQLLSVCHTVLYLRAPRLFETLLQSKADGSHLKTLTKLAKVDILILDDLFLTPLSDAERKDLLEIIEDRHQKAPTVITSQCQTKEWHHIIGEPTIADAICDRLLHHAYKIELKGDSIRKTKK